MVESLEVLRWKMFFFEYRISKENWIPWLNLMVNDWLSFLSYWGWDSQVQCSGPQTMLCRESTGNPGGNADSGAQPRESDEVALRWCRGIWSFRSNTEGDFHADSTGPCELCQYVDNLHCAEYIRLWNPKWWNFLFQHCCLAAISFCPNGNLYAVFLWNLW